MGSHTKHGGYVVDLAKVRTYIVPASLADFKVDPNACLGADRENADFSMSSRLSSPRTWSR